MLILCLYLSLIPLLRGSANFLGSLSCCIAFLKVCYPRQRGHLFRVSVFKRCFMAIACALLPPIKNEVIGFLKKAVYLVITEQGQVTGRKSITNRLLSSWYFPRSESRAPNLSWPAFVLVFSSKKAVYIVCYVLCTRLLASVKMITLRRLTSRSTFLSCNLKLFFLPRRNIERHSRVVWDSA